MRRVYGVAVAMSLCLALGGCVALTDRATHVGAFSAQLNAHGHTDSSPAHYYFQYAVNKADLGTAQGQQTPVRGPIPPNVPGNGSDQAFSESVSGLSPGTRYYFRVCGGDATATPDVCAPVRSFKTRAGISFTTPGSYSWTVPDGVTRASFDVYGAAGGAAAYVKPPSTIVVTGTGGLGAHVQAILSVTPGQTLAILVGGRGGDGGSQGAAGGFNGGAGDTGGIAGVGGGGGGASDVRTGAGDTSGLSSRLLVAGGGGGASTLTGTDARGGDGGLVGADGQPGSDGQLGGSQGGGGGGASAGGAGGAGVAGFPGTTSGASGALGVGGQGAPAPAGNGDTTFGAGGGGGAGGLYGGGGGGSGAVDVSGGYFEPPAAGGGGSSLATVNTGCQPTFFTGVQSGDGLVTITYSPRGC